MTPEEIIEQNKKIVAGQVMGPQGILYTPSTPITPVPPIATVNPSAQPLTHIVQQGETLSGIAKAQGVQIGDISGYRSGNPNLIFPGEKLTINKPQTIEPPKAETEPEIEPPKTLEGDISSILSQRYGINIDSDAFSFNPTKSISDLVREVMTATGLPEYKTKIEDLTKEIETVNNEKINEIAEVNDISWLSEGMRRARIQRINEKYEQKLGNKINTLQLLQNAQDDARQEAQFVATMAVNQYDKERQFQWDKLGLLIDQAEKQVEAANKLQKIDPNRYKSVQGGLYDIEEKNWLIAPKKSGTGEEGIGLSSSFWAAIDRGRNELQQGETWGNVWNRIKAQFPDVPNETIDNALGVSWREGGAYEKFTGKKKSASNGNDRFDYLISKSNNGKDLSGLTKEELIELRTLLNK